jgi:hypothetical protein
MVAFIQRTDNPEIPPPYNFPGITIMSFRLPAKLAKLQALCDDLLNIGSIADRGFEYRAFLDFVDMEIVTYPKMLFAEKPYSHWGFATQQELYFRFFVWKFFDFGGLQFPADIFPQLFFPYIFVDNSWSMISGRNVIGFPKVMACFQPTPVLGASPLNITASALVLKTHSEDTKLEFHPIVEIRQADASAVATTVAPGLPSGLWPWTALAKTAIADPYLQEQLPDFPIDIPTPFSTVQMKQFRDLPTDACFQGLVQTPFIPSNFGALNPLPPVTVTVHKYASLDIASSLGFAPDVAMRPSLQYSISLDMYMSNGIDLFINR